MRKNRHFSGKFVLRVTPSLHERLVAEADEACVSLNQLCVDRIAAGGRQEDALSAMVGEAVQHLGSALLGVALFGSYARGEANDGSDVDALFVTRPNTRITRSLYKPWDTSVKYLGRFPIEPHIVRMPAASERISALWAEVSIDGVVLLDPTLTLSRYLSHVRRAIIGGVIEKRTVNGETYWTAA